MKTQDLKNKIIARINQIDDEKTLSSIDVLLNSSNENIAKFLSISLEKMKDNTISETEDFTGYIKEWVKSM
jgi:hypothetical protein